MQMMYATSEKESPKAFLAGKKKEIYSNKKLANRNFEAKRKKEG